MLGILLGLALSACGGGGGGGGSSTPLTPPSISNLAYTPTSVPVSLAGNFTVNGTLNFADSGGDVASLTVRITDAGGAQISTVTQNIAGAGGQTTGTLSGAFQVTAATVGTYTIHVTVADNRGSQSNELTGPFQVLPVDSQAAVVATTGPAPAALSSANGRLYWSEPGTNALLAVAVSGGSTTTLTTRVVDIQAMGFVGTDVIWEDDRPVGQGVCGSSTTQRVISRTSANGLTAVLDRGYSCRYSTGDIVVVGGTVYWTSSTVSPDTYALHATPIAGGASTVVYQGNTPIVALIGLSGALYWMENRFATSTGAIRAVTAPGGPITTLASGFDSAANTFAVDGTNVYYTTPNYPRSVPPFTETLVAQPLAGGAAATISGAISTPIRLAVTAGNVVWTDASGVNAIPVGGGAITQLAATASHPNDLLIDGGNALWSESSGFGHGESGAIRSVPVTGGSISTVYQGGDAPQRLAMDASARLNWTEGGSVGLVEGFSRVARLTAGNAVQTVLSGISSPSPAFVVNATDLYVADLQRIKRVPLAGGMPENVAATDESQAPASLAVDGSRVYWDSTLQGSAYSAPLGGGPVTLLASAGAQSGPGGSIRVGTDGKVYWSAGANLLSAPLAGGAPGVVTQQGPTGAFVIDATHAYFVDSITHDMLVQPLAGGASTALTSGNAFSAGAQLVMDGANVYVMSGNEIVKVALAGGAITPVLYFVSGAPANTTFAVDGTKVYWTEPAAMDIRASAK
jgi:hypothetical protein